ncbi:MAG: hypothetical protein ACJ76K_02200 [Solirubrobacteraceae bacterium]|jgi:hypothetical protein
MPPPNQRERAEKRRLERLALIDEQVREGSLTIRQMTPDERKRWARPDNDGDGRRSGQRRR